MARPSTLVLMAVAGTATLLSVMAANAFERPTNAPKPCPRYGPGFVEMPGTRTCVRIGGRVESSVTAGTRRISRDDIAGFGTSARVSADTRTDTEYGPLRTYVRIKAGSSTR